MLRRPLEFTLAAVIGVMNHPLRPPLSERHVKRCQHQFGAQMSGHRPAYDFTAERVEHHRQGEKAGPGWNVADIGDPQTIGRRGSEVAFDQICSGFGGAIAHGGDNPPAPADAVKPRRVHQPCHPLAPDPQALRLELGVNPRHAIGLARAAMNRGDSCAQFQIRLRPCRGRPLLPRVVTAGGDAQHAAHGGNSVHGLVSPYECERRDGVAPVS
jgi:hypothetical protein